MQRDRRHAEVDHHEPVCSYCGHGRDLHSGPGDQQRAPGWCMACEDRRDGSPTRLLCRWFEP